MKNKYRINIDFRGVAHENPDQTRIKMRSSTNFGVLGVARFAACERAGFFLLCADKEGLPIDLILAEEFHTPLHSQKGRSIHEKLKTKK